ncbi:methionine aminotransferase [Flavisolibacter ginsenosidimutans]|uniref:Aminotransferase class I/II-fold pyridoxal phosphate-dependent enzyme n=1 Tax=Flavisolibacter ginsenosidimutans TaxID=661481 RepID=A0A5B8ULG3_9BACT|nr:methionine aminotransferase [Flavisolibacter ginsenosidimutans]QEC57019.1 aminotransferase class I/II-fold pyridoxal phosphate-dependent enzyme [Flavisolibacter ginsenosidimutans]
MIQSKLPNVGTTIFTTMSVAAAQHKAINLGQGFPDFPMSEELVALVNEAMRTGHNQYTHMNGYVPLREALAEKTEYLYKAKINPDTQITVTPGGTYALYTALTTILQPNDEVIVFEPAYDCYIPAIELNGAKAVSLQLTFPDYKIDWAEVKKSVTEKTRAIMINSPHNPTGSVLTEEDIAQLREVVKDTNIIIISDEVYEHLIFDGYEHQSILKYPDLLKRSFVSFSFGKVYHCTGWKLGYSISSEYLMNEFRKIHQFNAFSCDTPKQVALSNFLKKRENYLELGSFLQAKRNYFQQGMSQTKLKPLPTHGSYFQIYSYEGLSGGNEKDFALHLTKEFGVATIPVSAFYQQDVNNKVLRFCFCKKEETLDAAIERLTKL